MTAQVAREDAIMAALLLCTYRRRRAAAIVQFTAYRVLPLVY